MLEGIIIAVKDGERALKILLSLLGRNALAVFEPSTKKQGNLLVLDEDARLISAEWVTENMEMPVTPDSIIVPPRPAAAVMAKIATSVE